MKNQMPSPHWGLVVGAFAMFPIGATVSLIYALRTQSKKREGDISGAQKASRVTSVVGWTSVGIGILVILLALYTNA